MQLIDPRYRNWKDDLLKGRVDRRTATSAGKILGQLHTRSGQRADIPKRFASQRAFLELRVTPFFMRVAARNTDLAPIIDQMVADMANHRTALVHGDYSPKNILADGPELVILDCEVAHWGDPRFDIAFCLAHLFLKALRRDAPTAALTDSALAFITSYRCHGPEVLDGHLLQLLGALLLARLEGDSPVEYLNDLDIPAVKKVAISLLEKISGPVINTVQVILENAK
jgi:aminoglycoside phosphotransferase (APT) family kinase protein